MRDKAVDKDTVPLPARFGIGNRVYRRRGDCPISISVIFKSMTRASLSLGRTLIPLIFAAMSIRFYCLAPFNLHRGDELIDDSRQDN